MSDPIDPRVHRALAELQPEDGASGGALPLSVRLQACATPGAGIAMVDRGALVWAGGVGARACTDVTAVTARTRFQAASISKPVFALAVLRLVARGALDLDADVDRYLVSWRLPERDGRRPRVTLRQLLSHSAGVGVDGFKGYAAGAPLPTTVETLQGIPPANNPPVVVEHPPGVVRYSGGGTTIAQLAVVEQLGRPLPALMDELVLAPLGMTDSSFEPPPAPGPSIALGHLWNGVAVPGGWHRYPEMAAAGLWTTAADLAQLCVAVLDALAGRRSALDLPRALVDAMLQPQAGAPAPGAEYAGLGWFCRGAGDRLRFGHNGTNEGYVSTLWCAPATGQAAIALLNANQGAPLRAEIVAAIARAFDWPAPP